MLQFRATAGKGWMVNHPLKPLRFPAGEMHFALPEHDEAYTPTLAIWRPEASTLNEELVLLGMYADYVRQRGFEPKLFAPYFPGARADRGAPFGARVYAQLVNAMGFESVTILDPHSPVIVKELERVRVIDSTHVLKRAVFGRTDFVESSWAGIIAPDAGAVERATRVAEATGLPLFKADKTRDFATGKLSGFSCEKLPDEGRLLLVDDICEGGGTFCGLAEAAGVGRERLALWVTHGSFTGRAAQLTDYFGQIYTTDSLMNARNPELQAMVTPLPAFHRYGPFMDVEKIRATAPTHGPEDI